MYSAWTKHILNEEDKEQFRNEVKSARRVLERQNTLVEEAHKDIEDNETNVAIFDKPNWKYRQAYHLGFKKACRMIQKLNNLDQQG